MRSDERWSKILERLASEDHVSTKELSEALGVSSVTIRSDLQHLEDRGRIKRVLGGAMLATKVLETTHEARASVDGLQKLAIAVKALSLIEPGTSIVLDVGTSTYALAELIAEDQDLTGLTVVTNGLRIATALEGALPRNEVFVTGGMLRVMQHSLVQSGVIEGLRRFRSSVAFIGCDGIHPEHGITTTNLPEADVKEAMRSNSDRAVLLAAGSKLGEVGSVRVNDVAAFDTLITSEDADPVIVAQLQELGMEVLIAEQQLAFDAIAASGGALDETPFRGKRLGA